MLATCPNAKLPRGGRCPVAKTPRCDETDSSLGISPILRRLKAFQVGTGSSWAESNGAGGCIYDGTIKSRNIVGPSFFPRYESSARHHFSYLFSSFVPNSRSVYRLAHTRTISSTPNRPPCRQTQVFTMPLSQLVSPNLKA